MSVEKIRGIIISETAKGESNKQLLLLAKDKGLVWLSAKGAKNTKSKLLAGTQLFAYGDFTVHVGKGFYSVTQVDLISSFFNIRLDMESLAEGVYMTELLRNTCQRDLEQNEVLQLTLRTLGMLEKNILPPSLVSRIFEVKYLQLSGFLAEGCANCGDDSIRLFYHHKEGVLLCPLHKQSGDLPVLPAVQKAISHVLTHDGTQMFGFQLSKESLEQLDFVLGEMVDVHMGMRLKSRDFGKGLF
ncbi:DNA repair protein RecO [Chakrabartyella piscis]|uniref:DNA repair protein RecO n=1 Tax=Chakrabartyella piscis TaxID=2918914 RepID=UPI002958B772|nr:DNA repair protein RecO [Chakrabartyella piscis]